MTVTDTIFALSTVPGKSGIAVVRLTGPDSFAVLKNFTKKFPPIRQACLRTLTFNNETLDRAIVICFLAGSSYSGENMVEFHLHGSRSVVKSFLSVLGEDLGLRQAEPGEFTRRALENGCLDLVQVEGLADLMNSETNEQRKQSLKFMSGGLEDKTKDWRIKLLTASALTELMIDFSDEDVPKDTIFEVKGILNYLTNEFLEELKKYKNTEIVRDGFDIAIIGKPNSGKSSLLNFLAGSDKAIVSEEAGTTRDIIELRMDINGYAINFFDTAGIRPTDDNVEKIGIENTIKKSSKADLRVVLISPEENLSDYGKLVRKSDLIFCSKSDVRVRRDFPGISSKTGEGVNILFEKLEDKLINVSSYSGYLINERHRRAIVNCANCLKAGKDELENVNVRVEIVAEELRAAVRELDLLVGKINVEDLLGHIFSAFCIGK